MIESTLYAIVGLRRLRILTILALIGPQGMSSALGFASMRRGLRRSVTMRLRLWPLGDKARKVGFVLLRSTGCAAAACYGQPPSNDGSCAVLCPDNDQRVRPSRPVEIQLPNDNTRG